MSKKTVFIDLDGVIVDLIPQATLEFENSKGTYEQVTDVIDVSETIFLDSKPIEHALESVSKLEAIFDVYILSTAPWLNIHAWTQKRIWVEKYMPSMYKKLILTHHKNLLIGDFLIDDRTHNGASEFQGEHIHIFTPKFPDWETVVNYLTKPKDHQELLETNTIENVGGVKKVLEAEIITGGLWFNKEHQIEFKKNQQGLWIVRKFGLTTPILENEPNLSVAREFAHEWVINNRSEN